MTKSLLTVDLASRFAGIALAHVGREYPHVLQHVLDGPSPALTPRALHPVFFGSFDWHSCVHSHWMMARLLRRFPGMPEAARIRARFDEGFTSQAMAGEVAYFRLPSHAGFERPYGWAWLLMLAAELERGKGPFAQWASALRPLSTLIAGRFAAFLRRADYPVRAGVHSNTAFALALALDYALASGDDALASVIRVQSQDWYGRDAACQAWEPGGDEFLSPALIEAELMRRALGREAFGPWLARFLPDLATGRPVTLFDPARVSDRSDGQIAHLDGLNLSRAWCWRGIAASLAEADPLRGVALATAQRHLASSLPFIAGDYMGEHWLASFAVLALETS